MAKATLSYTDHEPRGATAKAIEMLVLTKDGVTAGEIAEKINQVNRHSRPSLQLLADRFGHKLIVSDRTEWEDGQNRYRFVPAKSAKPAKAKAAAKPVKAAAAKAAAPAKKAAAASAMKRSARKTSK